VSGHQGQKEEIKETEIPIGREKWAIYIFQRRSWILQGSFYGGFLSKRI